MKKGVRDSVVAYVMALIVGFIGGIILFRFGHSGLKDFLTGFALVELGLVIIFLIFFIPIEREWITRRSILWKALTWYDLRCRGEINLCEIPGMIMTSAFLGIAWLIFFLAGNIFLPIISGKYLNFRLQEEELPLINKLSFRGKQIKPWVIMLNTAIIYGLILLARWLSANMVFFYRTLAVLSVIGTIAGFIWLLVELGAIKSIWDFFLAIHKKNVCYQKNSRLRKSQLTSHLGIVV